MKHRLNFTQANPICYILIAFLFFYSPSIFSGSLDSPAAINDAGSSMYTLNDVYNRLNSGTTATLSSGSFIEPTAGPGATGHTLNEIMEKAPVSDNVNGATATEVLVGKKYWELKTATWGQKTGIMPNIGQQNIIPSASATTIKKGFHDGTGLVSAEVNLVTANIKSGVSIFGVSGKTAVVDTSTGNALAGDILSGKIAWINGFSVTGTVTTQTLSEANDTLAAGTYAATTLATIDSDLISANIKSGITVFGVAGKTEVVDTVTGDAVASDILSGKIAWVDGVSVTGSLATKTLTNANDTLTAGNYAGTTLSAVDTDLTAANIKSGITIFGVAGKTEVVDTVTGDAVASDILSGKIAWVDGVSVAGSLATKTLTNANDTLTAGNYAGTTLSAVDTDLTAANIKCAVVIFGITGTYNCP